MAAASGGRFIFTTSFGDTTHSGVSGVQLGINDGSGTISPGPVAGALNIEVFTDVPFGGPLPPLDPGFQEGVIDPGATIVDGFLTGTELELFGGAYRVRDSITGSNTPALMQLGAGNQTVAGAVNDTLVGGSGNQDIDDFAGGGHLNSIVGGTGSYSVSGGDKDTIVGAPDPTSLTTAQIFGVDGLVVLPRAGNYTVSNGFFDTVTAAPGNANADIVFTQTNFIDLTGNTGTDTVNATYGRVTVVAGGGATTVYGGQFDSLVAGAGGTTYVDGEGGGMTIVGGSAGNDIVIGSIASPTAGPDTILGNGGASLDIQSLGRGDVVNLTGATGSAAINATAGIDRVTLGSGPASIYGGAGDTIALGAVGQSPTAPPAG